MVPGVGRLDMETVPSLYGYGGLFWSLGWLWFGVLFLAPRVWFLDVAAFFFRELMPHDFGQGGP